MQTFAVHFNGICDSGGVWGALPLEAVGRRGRWKSLHTASYRCTVRPTMQDTLGPGAEDSFRWFKSPQQDKFGTLSRSACLPLILEIQKAVWAVKISPRPRGRNETMTVAWSAAQSVSTSSSFSFFKSLLLKNYICSPPPFFSPIDPL